jgi:4-nitrophenyl phosphatase
MEAAWALEGDVPFVGTDPDMTVPVDEGCTVPGSGAILNAIAGVAGREPDRVMGKPSEEAVRTVREALGCAPEECLVVGDRLDTDIALGERAGMTTVLVLSGVTRRAEVADSAVTPDHVLDSLADLPELLAD